MSIALNRRVKELESTVKQLMLRMAELEEKESKPKRGQPVKKKTDIGVVKHANG